MSAAHRQRSIDLNADVGEGYPDADLMPLVTSASIACGAHAGNERTMRATLRLARIYAVTVGAHPGYPDREGFGRRATTHEPSEVEDLVAHQVARLQRLAADEGILVAYVKPHGALYNLSARDDATAAAIARAVLRVAPDARLVGLAGSRSLPAARNVGLVALAEGFPDRGYLGDGSLAPRGTPGAVIEDAELVAQRAVELATHGDIATLDGGRLALQLDTLCLHGDAPHAARSAGLVRAALTAAGVKIAPAA